MNRKAHLKRKTSFTGRAFKLGEHIAQQDNVIELRKKRAENENKEKGLNLTYEDCPATCGDMTEIFIAPNKKGQYVVCCNEGVGFTVDLNDPKDDGKIEFDVFINTPDGVSMFPSLQGKIHVDDIIKNCESYEVDVKDFIRFHNDRLHQNYLEIIGGIKKIGLSVTAVAGL